MLTTITKKIFGTSNQRLLKKLSPIVRAINDKENQMQSLDDASLQKKTIEFKEKLDAGASLEDLLIEAFAVVREASCRTLGMRPYDVQILGGIVLHQGHIAEMRTGEGKTLTATLPIYLNALKGQGAHVVTVNDYLARRDAEWMGAIYSCLGLKTGVVIQGMETNEKRAAYDCDITYGQNNEFGFDYLRDNMKVSIEDKVIRCYNYAIVDEVDSILIDEARTPLIISGPTDDFTEKYVNIDKVVRQLLGGDYYDIDEKSRHATLNEKGIHKVEDLLGIENLYDPSNMDLVRYANNALVAHIIKKRDVDYIVSGNEVIIVDEFTGRQMPGRRWSDGLHQAIEAKEKVEIDNESQTLASITFQNFFRMYNKLSGMTGTADTEAEEFKKIYNLKVVIIPTNKPMIRVDNPDVVFISEDAKYSAVCKEIQNCVSRGQPVLVGTANIDRSEHLSLLLKKMCIEHEVLNAKHHEREAEIVAQAGSYGKVTISTNMAGRGTDIVLGGNPEFLAMQETNLEASEEEKEVILNKCIEICANEKQRVLDVGGLHILGTERHESRRIDNQLRGRSGRQGDPGSSRFYVSLEDELMLRFGGEKLKVFMEKLGAQANQAIEGRMVANSIANAQKKIEGRNFDIRKHLLEYDDVMNKQREIVYGLRNQMLEQRDISSYVRKSIGDVIENMVMNIAEEDKKSQLWNLEVLESDFVKEFGLSINAEEIISDSINVKESAQNLFNHLQNKAFEEYEARCEKMGLQRMEEFQKIVILQSIDILWKDHLGNLDHLKDGIGLRGYGQKNPLHEYQREAFSMFTNMLLRIQEMSLRSIFQSSILSESEIESLEKQEQERQKQQEKISSTLHSDVEKRDQKSTESSNRAQRRKKTNLEQLEPKLEKEDYFPSVPTTEAGSKNKKNKRNKAKAARKARKRARR